MTRTVRIFLASSAELAEHRRKFALFTGEQNKRWVPRGVFLELVQWEDFLDSMSVTRLQDEYNRALQGCEMFVMLFRSKVGKYTAEEFGKAFGQFKETGRPLIWTYFNDAATSTGRISRDVISLLDFQDKLKSLGHFQTVYSHHDTLCSQFRDQLDKLEAKGFFSKLTDSSSATANWTATAGAPSGVRNPYPGLAAFRPEDSEFFFGREDDSARVVEKLRAERLVSLCGGSGTGKSSLAAAGVITALRARDPGLTCLRFKPQVQPLRQLVEVLDRALPEGRGSLFGPRVTRLEKWLLTEPGKALEGLGKPVLLLADQFEELFTQTDTAQANAFRDVFEALGQLPDVLRLLTLRSELMGRLADWLPEGDFARSLVHLQPITQPERLRRLIRRPAEQSGVVVDDDVVESLVTAASTARGALPLVALTLHRLFEQRDPNQGLTMEAYRRMGELAGVVQSTAAQIDEALDADPALAAACDRLFGALATVIDEVPTRRTAPVAALRADPAFADPGIHAWRALEADLPEPLRSFVAPEPLRLLEELKTDACPQQRREEIGLCLNQMGDPRRGVGLTADGLPDIEWIDVPAGRVRLYTQPPMDFDVKPFRMARYPVTWAQYDAFLMAEDGFGNPASWSDLDRWGHHRQPSERRWGFNSYLAVNVSWFDAMAYGRWLGSRPGLPVSLPTEWEWQWAAAGPEGRAYPWGDWQELRANTKEPGIGRTTAVGMYPQVRAGFDGRGGDDLSGNVWEWCLNEGDKLSSTGPAGYARRVLRGGSWNHTSENCRASYRGRLTPDDRGNLIGFRLVVSCPIPGKEP